MSRDLCGTYKHLPKEHNVNPVRSEVLGMWLSWICVQPSVGQSQENIQNWGLVVSGKASSRRHLANCPLHLWESAADSRPAAKGPKF